MADDDKNAEFAFNLFTDIAPLLALFGDQFAKQFTSESLTWVDHLIFAMVPLGILTAIAGAIRVQGPRIAKSFIGRGRENRALAEIELMSSTSKEVCELFNGKSIIRVLGKPKIAQILVFPHEYETLKRRDEETDRTRLDSCSVPDCTGNNKSTMDNKATEQETLERDVSCGIHTFETASSQEGSRTELLEIEEYHSRSYQVISGILGRLTGVKHTLKRVQTNRNNVIKSLGPPNLQLGLSSDQFENSFPRRGHETFIAALTAVTLQAGLIAIATVTVYHEPTRRAIKFQPKAYGYSCYIAGSVMLSVGVGICSLAVERNTIEYNWKVLSRNKNGGETAQERINVSESEASMADSPRLLWLQKSQEVNDQSFSGYAILAGPKHHITTSSRIEDMGPKPEANNSSTRSTLRLLDGSDDSTKGGNYITSDINQSRTNPRKWELITVGAAVAAGTGFIIQFIGLRGLTYPISIAQLVAILLMALARALIRRRLGREPCHCRAFPRFEVDFLATRLVYFPTFRNFHMGLEERIPLLNQQRPNEVLCWRVKTAEASDDRPYLSDTLQDVKRTQVSRDGQEITKDRSELPSKQPGPLKRTHNLSNMEQSSVSFSIEEASSQQLLRVRERLGDLSQWPSEALESARSLVYSVEAFMDEFFPKRLDSFDWVIETIRLSTEPGIGRQDYVTVPIQKSPNTDKWQAGIGTVDAILSLWIASIEAQAADVQKNSDEANANKTPGQTFHLPNWRRTKAGVDMRYNYCRILGDDFEDGSLKRDLSWWVDELIAEQSDSRSTSSKVAPNHREDKKLEEIGYRWNRSEARGNAKATDLMIGFNGRSKDHDTRHLSSKTGARELAISSSGILPNILAQHLFTGFIWSVVEQLPENCFRQGILSSEEDVDIENRHAFDSHEFVDTWSRPTLRHRQLMKVVRRIENVGLGTQNDVLLCMIPAFSYKDLLPNHAMLKILPQIRRGQGWAETARCYNRLLEQGLRVKQHGTMAEEKFCYNVVVETIDFISFASEPYDEHVRAPGDLSVELEDIVARLVSIRFAPVVKKLAQAYILQRRNKDIAAILKLFGTPASLARLADNEQLERLFGREADLQGCLDALKVADKLEFSFLEKSLGFSKYHRTLYEALSHTRKKDMVQPSASKLQVKAAKARDIFGWTPLHYAAFLEDKEILYRYFDPAQVNGHLSLQTELGPLNRSPIHMAAISGSLTALQWISKCLGSTENKRNAYDTVGIDGMSPLHLATKNGHAKVVAKIIRKKRLRTTTGVDFWGRTAIHLAASHGHDAITKLLLNDDTPIDALDEIGKTPLDYLVKIQGELQDARGEEDMEVSDGDKCAGRESGEQEADHAGATNADADTHGPVEIRTQSFEARKAELIEQKREIFIEFARRSLKGATNRDKSGRTYLHHAVVYANIRTIEKLLSIGYDLETKDSEGFTALLFALQVRRHEIVLKLLEGFASLAGLSACTSVKTERGNTPMMLAAVYGYVDIVRVLAEQQPSKLRREDTRRKNDEAIIQEKPQNVQLTQEASEEDYGPLARNVNGETALFLALQCGQVEVADYLLHKSGQLQENPCDKDGNSLLVMAVRRDSVSVLVPSILKEWTGIVNQPESWFGQTPLSLACENGHEATVDLLLGIEEVDVNKPAPGWEDRTPLHVAAANVHLGIVQKLLSHPKIVVDLRDSSGESAIDKASRNGESPILQALLTHDQTSSKRRLEFVSSICKSGNQDIQNIVPSVLQHIEDAAITDEELMALIDSSVELHTSVPYVTFVERAFSRDTWKRMDHPYHLAVRIGNLDWVKRLKEYGREITDLDEDGWSCIEYAKTYRSEEVQDDILDLIQLPPTKPGQPQKPGYNTPKSLHYPELADSIEVSLCKDHMECPGLHYVTVNKQEDKFRHASIRSEHCVPPPSDSNKHFYFEVTVLNKSDSKILGLGFCNKRYPMGAMPGWYRVSWAYHGDDGALFLNNANSDSPFYKTDRPSDDFGAKGEFGANDVVGVGLNLETGKGFVTLNGKLRDVGDIFEGEKFNDRKMYPCVGIDTTDEGVGLRFVINFGGSVDHPFKYKGSYP